MKAKTRCPFLHNSEGPCSKEYPCTYSEKKLEQKILSETQTFYVVWRRTFLLVSINYIKRIILNKWLDMFSTNGETYLLKFCRHKRRAVQQNIPEALRAPSPLTRAVRQQQTCTPTLWKCQRYWMPAVKGSRCICNSVNVSARLCRGIKTSEMTCRQCLEIHRCLLIF